MGPNRPCPLIGPLLIFCTINFAYKISFTLESWDVGASQTRICLGLVRNTSTIFSAKTGNTFFWRGLWWRKHHNYATTLQLHQPLLLENSKFLSKFHRLCSINTNSFLCTFSRCVAEKPLHINQYGVVLGAGRSLDSGWRKHSEKPRSAFRISGL